MRKIEIRPAAPQAPCGDGEIGDSDRDTLIQSFMPLVRYLAHRIAIKLPQHVELDDLVNYGVLGLIDAVEKFDAGREIKFKTYAEFRIRGAIFDGLRGLDWVPRSVRKQKRIVEESCAKLEQKFGRQATDEEVSAALGVGLVELYKVLDSLQGVGQPKSVEANSQDRHSGIDSEGSLSQVEDQETENPMERFQRQEQAELIWEIIRNMPEKERYVVSLYYFDDLTMKEIGTVLNITESRVSQLHTKSMIHLRQALETQVRAGDS